MTKKSTPYCWHCSKALSNMNHPKKEYWFTEIEIEPGRTVKVHKTCQSAAKESIRKLTANIANNAAYHGDIDGDFNY